MHWGPRRTRWSTIFNRKEERGKSAMRYVDMTTKRFRRWAVVKSGKFCFFFKFLLVFLILSQWRRHHRISYPVIWAKLYPNMYLYHTLTIYTVQQSNLLLRLFFKEIFQDLAEQKSEKSLDELRATSLKVQHVLAAHKVIQQRCVTEKHIKSSSQHEGR